MSKNYTDIDINKINSFHDLSDEDKEYLITRTDNIFRHQFVFYYELNGSKGGLFEGRPIVRALEETLLEHFEQFLYLRSAVNDIIKSDKGCDKKLREISEYINGSTRCVPAYLRDECLLD